MPTQAIDGVSSRLNLSGSTRSLKSVCLKAPIGSAPLNSEVKPRSSVGPKMPCALSSRALRASCVHTEHIPRNALTLEFFVEILLQTGADEPVYCRNRCAAEFVHRELDIIEHRHFRCFFELNHDINSFSVAKMSVAKATAQYSCDAPVSACK